MVRGFTDAVRRILLDHGCERVRFGKGDHEVWRSPHAKRPFVLDGRIMSREMANIVLKQAGIDVRL